MGDLFGGGGSNNSFTPTTTSVDAGILPYRNFALGESAKLYASGGPKYYGGQNYIDPSQATTDALNMAEARATSGSPLVKAAQQHNLSTINGDYLNGNQFFNGAFKAATQAATQSYQDNVNSALSNASTAGRYGSSAMGNVLNRANQTYADSLNNTAGTLAYNNYAAERSAQENAVTNAGSLANLDYADAQRLYEVGQAREGYDKTALDANMERWNYDQNLPYENLANFGSFMTGLPQGSSTREFDGKLNTKQKAAAKDILQSLGLLG